MIPRGWRLCPLMGATSRNTSLPGKVHMLRLGKPYCTSVYQLFTYREILFYVVYYLGDGRPVVRVLSASMPSWRRHLYVHTYLPRTPHIFIACLIRFTIGPPDSTYVLLGFRRHERGGILQKSPERRPSRRAVQGGRQARRQLRPPRRLRADRAERTGGRDFWRMFIVFQRSNLWRRSCAGRGVICIACMGRA